LTDCCARKARAVSQGARRRGCRPGLKRIAQPAGVGDNLDLHGSIAFLQPGVGMVVISLKIGKKVRAAIQAPRQNDRACADLVGQRTEHDEEQVPKQQRNPCDQKVGGIAINLMDDWRKKQRVEMAGLTDHALTHGAAVSAIWRSSRCSSWAKASRQRGLRAHCPVLHLLNTRRLLGAPRIKNAMPAQHRYQERECASPGREVGLRIDGGTREQDHQQRQ